MAACGSEIVQNCWVVKDLDAAMERWGRVMGVGPFFVLGAGQMAPQTGAKGDGAPVRRGRVALAHSGGVQIELVERAPDDSQPEMTPPGGEGFHHVAVITDDFEGLTARYEAEGLKRLHGGFSIDMRFAFYDARPMMGCILEVLEGVPRIRARSDMVRQAAEAWDGTGDLVRYI